MESGCPIGPHIGGVYFRARNFMKLVFKPLHAGHSCLDLFGV